MGNSDKVSNSDLSVDANQKEAVDRVEENEKVTTPPAYNSEDEGPRFDEARTKKLLRKLDWHIVPFLALLYLSVRPSSAPNSFDPIT